MPVGHPRPPPGEGVEELGSLIVDTVQNTDALRRSTREWYADHREELSIQRSLETVLATYVELARQ